MPRILISCGEASGDLYAGALARELRAADPGVEIVGFGGERLRGAGAALVGDYHGLAVTGLAEAFRVLPRARAMYRRIVGEARARRPDVFVAIDFPDFNFRVADAMHRMGVPVVYYVSPQLWAWRPGRIAAMRRFASKVLVIFPFEATLYRDAGIAVEFVGHPLLEIARATEPREPFLRSLRLDPSAPTVALLPGSRPNELRAILPDLVAAAGLIAGRVRGAQFVIARAPNLEDRLFVGAADLRSRRSRRAERPVAPPIVVVEGRADDVMAAADVVLTASGTATIQAAIHGRPMVIVYRLSPLTYAVGKPFVKVDTYGMVNLVAGARIVPELVQHAFTPDAVANEAVSLLTDRARASAMRAALEGVRAKLGGPGASRRAAEAVLAAVYTEAPRA